MKKKEVPVRVFLVQAHCDKCGQEMQYIHQPPAYSGMVDHENWRMLHICDCGEREYLNKPHPFLTWEKIK